MKKWMMCFFTMAVLAAALSVTAFAVDAEEGIQASTVNKTGEHAANIDVTVGANADRMTVAYTDAEAGREYLVVATTDKVTGPENLKAEEIVYINQYSATGKTVSMLVYPKALSDGTYKLWISSNASNGITTLEQVASFKAKRPAYKLGYIDDDDKITASDALCALQMSVGKGTWTDVQRSAANVDGDDKITASDALKILQAAVGKVTL